MNTHSLSGFLLQGAILGLSAGFSPGPLLALVLSETVRRGTAAGVQVALAPLATDLPIVLLSLAVLSRIPSRGFVLGAVGAVGGLFVVRLGVSNLGTKGVEVDDASRPSFSFARAVAVNALSPHPYLFWLTVGAPITLKAADEGWLPAAAFVGAFYLLLVGSKVAIAVAAGRGRALLRGGLYLATMRVLGALLCLLGALLLRDALSLLLAGP